MKPKSDSPTPTKPMTDEEMRVAKSAARKIRAYLHTLGHVDLSVEPGITDPVETAIQEAIENSK